MERLQNTDMPLSSLMGIRQSIMFDDNSTNVKLQSKKKLEELNNMMLMRQQSVHAARLIREDINNNLINKLKKVLSKKFSLTREEYIVLIDKFNLKNRTLDRSTIIKMIQSLNIQKKYNDNKDYKQKTASKQQGLLNTYNSKGSNKIILNEPDDELFKDNSVEKSFDDKLQELINMRTPQDGNKISLNSNNYKPNINSKQTNNIVNNKPISNVSDKPVINSSLKNVNLVKDNNFNSYDISKPLNNMGDEIYFPPPNRDKNDDTSDDVENKANSLQNNRIQLNNTSNFKSNTNDSSFERSTFNKKPLSNMPFANSNNNTSGNESKSTEYNIKESLQQIFDNMQPREEKQINNEYEFNIMANIIDNKSKNNTVRDSFQFEINYNGKTNINYIKRVELISCFINENFYRKNNFKDSPYFFIKIKEFPDVLYLNGSSVGGFCQIIWEKKGNYYNYINTDKLFGVYKPSTEIELNKLTMEFYDHNGNILKELKSTESDQFNIVLKIVSEKPL